VLRSFLFITGPGHGAPSALACLYLEGAITKFYPQYAGDRAGLKALIRAFSFPGGFPSHVNAETPGAIHEGGELGYALAVAYGVFLRPHSHLSQQARRGLTPRPCFHFVT
jgi:xylulose-5-phosphate/fructose-6-phosphate phosphoketolase